MFETNIVVVGNVLAVPDWRVTANDIPVVTFRVASTARRFDREAGRWVDGDHLRLRVTCWRRLAENVAASVTVGDPVVVVGRLFTRDWTDNDGDKRTSYELEAIAVGHDLTRGRSRFYRGRLAAGTSESEIVASGEHVRGETAPLVPEDVVPVRHGDGIPEEREAPFIPQLPAHDPDPVTMPIARSGSSDRPNSVADDLSLDGPDGDEADATDESDDVAPTGHPRPRRTARRVPAAV